MGGKESNRVRERASEKTTKGRVRRKRGERREGGGRKRERDLEFYASSSEIAGPVLKRQQLEIPSRSPMRLSEAQVLEP